MYLLIRNPYRPPTNAEQVIMIQGEGLPLNRSADNSCLTRRTKIALYTENKEHAKSFRSRIASEVILRRNDPVQRIMYSFRIEVTIEGRAKACIIRNGSGVERLEASWLKE